MDVLELFRRAATLPGVALLEGDWSTGRRRSILGWEPASTLRIGSADRTTGANPLATIDRFLEREGAAGRTVIGALSYDLGPWIESAVGPPVPSDFPLAVLGSYAHLYVFDSHRARWDTAPPELPETRLPPVRVGDIRPSMDLPAYGSRFRKVHRWILDGDIYQANLAIGFDAELEGPAATLYERLSRSNPVGYGAFLDFGDVQVLSNSPELFLERTGNRITTRPIKGTRPRGRRVAEDRQLVAELRRDEKERAEHRMIVDLERNDLGRIARTGSVDVAELEVVRTYATLHHLESTVTATLVPGTPFREILRATFPGGSITGAPKIRAMQIIRDVEPEPRGFYTGGVIVVFPNGDFVMNVAIRTATVRRGRIRYAAGGGVVADSRAEREYQECLLKAKAFFDAASDGRGQRR